MPRKPKDYIVEWEKIWQLPLFTDKLKSLETKETIKTKKEEVNNIIENNLNKKEKKEKQRNVLREVILWTEKCELFFKNFDWKKHLTLKIRKKWEKRYYNFEVYLSNFSFEKEIKITTDDEQRFFIKNLKIAAIQKTDRKDGAVFTAKNRETDEINYIKNFNYFSYLFQKNANIHNAIFDEIRNFLLTENMQKIKD